MVQYGTADSVHIPLTMIDIANNTAEWEAFGLKRIPV